MASEAPVKEDAGGTTSSKDGEGSAASKEGTTAHEKPVIVAQSTIVKTGSTILEKNVDAQGNRQEIWHVKGLRVMKLSDNPHPLVCPDFWGGDIQSINFAVSDFAGLDWISATTYKGIKKYQGRDCILFNGQVSPLNAAQRKQESIEIESAKAWGRPVPEEVKVPAVAYIDLETRLPLLVTFGGEKQIYQYGAPPTSPLPLPAELAAPVKAYAQRMQRLSAPAASAF